MRKQIDCIAVQSFFIYSSKKYMHKNLDFKNKFTNFAVILLSLTKNL